MKGVRLIVTLVVAAAGLVALGAFLGRQLETPEQAQLRSEPERVAVTDPVRLETLEQLVRLRGEVVPEGVVEYVPPNDRPNVVTRVGSLSRDSRLVSGQPLVELAGRPVIILEGVLPVWRDFEPGMEDGPDITQLQQALVGLGLLEIQPNGSYDRATQNGVRALYESLGYPLAPVAPTVVPVSEVMFIDFPQYVHSYSAELGSLLQPGDISFYDRALVVSATPPPGFSDPLDEGLPVRLFDQSGDVLLETEVSGVTTNPTEEGDTTLRLSIPGLARIGEQAVVVELVLDRTSGPVLTAVPPAVFSGPGGPYVVVLDEGGNEVPVLVAVGVATIDRVEIRSNSGILDEGSPLVLNPVP